MKCIPDPFVRQLTGTPVMQATRRSYYTKAHTPGGRQPSFTVQVTHAKSRAQFGNGGAGGEALCLAPCPGILPDTLSGGEVMQVMR